MNALLIPDPGVFQKKFTGLEGDLAQRWKFFLSRCRKYPDQHPIDAALAFVATGQSDYGEGFRREFERFVAHLPSRDLSNQGQFHAWTNGLPTLRWALAFDWVAGRGLFTAGFERKVAAAFLGYAERLQWTVARSRMLTGDNQFYSVTLCCAVIGHLFGRKHFQSLLGEELLAYARRRLPDVLGDMPLGGYSGEGYYHNQVVAPLAALHCAFFESLGDLGIFNHRYLPSGVCVRDILTLDYHSVLPGGIMVPWDASYYHPIHVKMGLTYLAQRSGQPRYLAPIRRWRMFEGDPRPGWGRDDDAWTWLWWPEELKRMEDIPLENGSSWARDHVAFGLVGRQHESALFQNFDTAHGRHSPSASRCQSDPNNIVVVGCGVPLTLDGGYARTDGLDLCTPPERQGCAGVTGVGFHNCIILDHQIAYAAPTNVAGRLVRFMDSPELGMGESEVTDFYSDFGVTSIRRRSLQLQEGVFVVVDRVEALSSHEVTWQLLLRPYVREMDGCYVMDTPEAVRLTVVPPKGHRSPVGRLAGIPHVLENAADVLQVSQSGASVQMVSHLQVSLLSRFVMDLNDDWEVAVDAEGGAEKSGWHQPSASWRSLGRIDISRHASLQLPNFPIFPLPQRFIWDYMDCRETSETGRYDKVTWVQGIWLRKTFQVPGEAVGKRLLLRISRPPWYFKLFLDGQQIVGKGAPNPNHLGRANAPSAGVVELTPSAREGLTHHLVMAMAHPFPSTSPGVLSLEIAEEPPVSSFEILSDAVSRWSCAGQRVELVHDNSRHQTLSLGRWQTDALCAALKTGGNWGLAEATHLEYSGETFLRVRRGLFSGSYGGGLLTISELGLQAVMELKVPEGQLTILSGQRPQVMARLSREFRISVKPDPENDTRPNLICNQLVSASRVGDSFICSLAPSPGSTESIGRLMKEGDAFERREAVYAMSSRTDEGTFHLLTSTLQDSSWTVRCAAVNVLGWRLERRVVPRLLELLEVECRRDVYHGLTNQDDFPQWPGGSNQDAQTDLARLPKEWTAIPGEGMVAEPLARWRFKQALLEALGLIGDLSAAPLIVRILLGDSSGKGWGMTRGDFYPVRKAAAEALGLIGGTEALSTLKKMADESEVNTRKAAQQGIHWLQREG